MYRIVLAAAFCVFFAASAHADGKAFPPDNCTALTPFMSFNGTTTGGNTYCSNGQGVLNNALPICNEGEIIQKKNGVFVCAKLGAQALGRQYYGAYCPNSNHCYVYCPAGKVVVSGGCFSNRAYGLQGSKAVVYDHADPDGGAPWGTAVSTSPGPSAAEGWQCIYPTDSDPATDIEAQVICMDAGWQ